MSDKLTVENGFNWQLYAGNFCFPVKIRTNPSLLTDGDVPRSGCSPIEFHFVNKMDADVAVDTVQDVYAIDLGLFIGSNEAERWTLTEPKIERLGDLSVEIVPETVKYKSFSPGLLGR